MKTIYQNKQSFLDASTHLYMRVCLLRRSSVHLVAHNAFFFCRKQATLY